MMKTTVTAAFAVSALMSAAAQAQSRPTSDLVQQVKLRCTTPDTTDAALSQLIIFAPTTLESIKVRNFYPNARGEVIEQSDYSASVASLSATVVAANLVPTYISEPASPSARALEGATLAIGRELFVTGEEFEGVPSRTSPNYLAGEASLHVQGREGLFYRCEVMMRD